MEIAIVMLLCIAGQSLHAMQKEDLLSIISSQSSAPNPVCIRSHDDQFSWILDRDEIDESKVLRDYLRDSELLLERTGNNTMPALYLASCMQAGDFSLFHSALLKLREFKKDIKVSQNLEDYFSHVPECDLYRIAAAAHFFQAPAILDGATSVIAQQLHKQGRKEKVLKEGICNVPLNEGLKCLIAQKIMSPAQKWSWLHADKVQGSMGNETQMYKISYSKLFEIYNPEFIVCDKQGLSIYTVFAKCSAVKGQQLSYDKKIEVWDINTRKSLHKLILPRTGLVTIDSENKRVAAQKEDFGIKEKLVKVWDIKTKKCIHEIPILHSDMKEITFSPKQNLLALCFSNQQIQILDLADKNGKIAYKQTLDGQKLQFDSEGKLAAIQVSDDIQIWDIQNNKLLKTLSCHGASIFSCTFNPRRPIVATGTSHGMRLWNFNAETLLNRHGVHAQFNGQGNRMATEYGVFDVEEGTPLLYFSEPFHKFAFNEQGTIYVGHYLEQTGAVRYHVYDLHKNTIIIVPNQPDSIFCGPNSMHLNREGNLLITRNYKQCNVYNLFDLEVKKYLDRNVSLEAALVLSEFQMHQKILYVHIKDSMIRTYIQSMPKALQKCLQKKIAKDA